MSWAIPALSHETRDTIPTREAAFHLRRSPATLHAWSCGSRNGPIQPVRDGGQLRWRVADIKNLLGVEG